MGAPHIWCGLAKGTFSTSVGAHHGRKALEPFARELRGRQGHPLDRRRRRRLLLRRCRRRRRRTNMQVFRDDLGRAT